MPNFNGISREEMDLSVLKVYSLKIYQKTCLKHVHPLVHFVFKNHKAAAVSKLVYSLTY